MFSAQLHLYNNTTQKQHQTLNLQQNVLRHFAFWFRMHTFSFVFQQIPSSSKKPPSTP